MGDFAGNLHILDLEKGKTFFSIQAHKKIINGIDGIGGLDVGYGAPEILTGSADGCVRVWDPRQTAPVVSLEPVAENKEGKEGILPEAWSVGFGNSYNNDERTIAAGYDNGDLKFFDLRMNSLLWDTNLKNGVCGVEFDRKDIIMNKLIATSLEGKIYVFDLRTLHPEEGYAQKVEKGQEGTIWGVKHLPQNRELCVTQGGNGQLNLYKYNYPPERVLKDSNGRPKGVVGKLELLNSRDISQQPICAFDWNKDKIGLACAACLDQTCRVLIFTKLNLY